MDIAKYINARNTKAIFGLPYSYLQNLVTEGAVRSIKFGDKKQAGRLYRSADIEAALERMSLGRRPRRAVSVPAKDGDGS